MRKPLTVTLSVVCTLKGLSRCSIQRIKAMLLCIVYAMFFVDSVNIYSENYWEAPLCRCMQDARCSILQQYWHTLDLAKTCFFHILVLGGKIFLIFPIIYLRVGLRSNLHITLSDLVNPLISANSCSGWHNYSLWGLLFQFHSLLVSWLLNFIE